MLCKYNFLIKEESFPIADERLPPNARETRIHSNAMQTPIKIYTPEKVLIAIVDSHSENQLKPCIDPIFLFQKTVIDHDSCAKVIVWI